MFENIIYEQNTHWQGKLFYGGIKRSLTEKMVKFLDLDHILVVSGVRRSGKSFILKQIMNHLIEKKIPAENILFLNLEISALIPFKDDPQTLSYIFDDYMKEKDPKGKIYLFLDEIQFFEKWEVWVKEVYEKRKSNIKFILTGSNSNLLSSEFSTLLSGRTIEFRNYPFSFKRYLKYHNFNVENKQDYIIKKNKFKKNYETYFQNGGFPEIIGISDQSIVREILQNYLNTILIKDVVPRFKVRDVSQLEKTVQFLLSNVGKLYSYNNIAKMLDSEDTTIKDYINMLVKAFLFFELYKYDNSYKKQLMNQKKIYVIDGGISNNLAFKFSKDTGRLLENLVFIELKRRGKEIYYHKDKAECDFVIKEGLDITEAIQVTDNLQEEDTKKREIKGIKDAMNKYNLKEGLILTQDEEYEIKEDNKKIKVMPVWKWLLVQN